MPDRPSLAQNDAKAFARGAAGFLSCMLPDRFTAMQAKYRRVGMDRR